VPLSRCGRCGGQYRRLDRHKGSRSCMVAAARRASAAAPPARPTADPPMPGGLGDAGRSLWQVVTSIYTVWPERAAVLAAACREADREAQAEAALAADGLLVRDRYGQRKVHPAAQLARQSRLAQARLLREVGLGPPSPDAEEAS
jgi:hypothetical protein